MFLEGIMLGIFSKPIVAIVSAQSRHIDKIAALTKTTYAKTFIDTNTGKGCFNDNELDALKQDVFTRYPGFLNHANHCLLVIEEGSQIWGYAKMDLKEDSVFLDRIYVHPEKQSQGLGNRLFLACLEQATQHFKQNKMTLEVWDQNTKAIEYYKKNGFEVTSKTHQKKAASGITYSGFEMVCTDVKTACENLNSYICSKGSISKFER